MRKYDSYKNSGIEWIGEIPSHWDEVRIKQLAIGEDTLFLDGDWIESKEIVFDEDNIRYITTGNIGEGKYKEHGSGYITEETFEKLNCTEVYPGDLIISRLNPPIGRACIIPDLGKRIVTSVDNVILRPNENYSKNFLVNFFSNSKYFEFTMLEGRGATMQRISRSILGNIKIVVPNNLEEQTAIANYLDRKTAEIDELIADKKRLLELYEEEKTAIINQAVTKGLDPNMPMKDSGIKWLGEIPAHWEVKRISWCFEIIGSGTTPKSTNREYYQDGEINWLLTGDLNDGEIFHTSKKITQKAIEDYSSLKAYPSGSIVMAMYGATIGRLGILKTATTVNQACCVLGNPLGLNKNYAFYVLLAARKHIINLSYGGGQPNISQELIKSFRMQAPTIDEQNAIVDYIENQLSRIDLKIKHTKKLIDLLTEYRTALISEVVTGKIKVTE